jgi:hypothetical protein
MLLVLDSLLPELPRRKKVCGRFLHWGQLCNAVTSRGGPAAVSGAKTWPAVADAVLGPGAGQNRGYDLKTAYERVLAAVYDMAVAQHQLLEVQLLQVTLAAAAAGVGAGAGVGAALDGGALQNADLQQAPE